MSSSLQGGGAGAEADNQEINKLAGSTKFYYLHTEQERERKREAYRNRPDIILKKQVREAEKVAKQAEKERIKSEARIQKQKERDAKIQEKIKLKLDPKI